jgi:hypothetical protein
MILLIWALLNVIAAPPASDTPSIAAGAFIRTYLKQPGYALLKGKNRRELAPYLSRAFLRNLDNASKCQEDWMRQQPRGSTDKPPFVDCCLFSSSNDWFPNSYSVGTAKLLKDGRYQVSIEYRYTTSTEDHRWWVAVIVKKEDGRYAIDDFVGDFDAEPPLKAWTLSRDWEGCRSGRWVGF